ncbi:MAG: M23 family metallopeptidase [Cellulosilyticum sp.]|nr:M23 family metallopeptidase [Cellulosilyticum sp.]
MKPGKMMRIFCSSVVIMTGSLHATTTQNIISQEIAYDGQYIDASTYNLTYTYIPGFLVSPLQVKGELLAPFNQARSGYTHQGIDIRAAEGTPVFAIADGIVTKAAPDSKGVNRGGGHMIFVDFGEGVEGRYMHLSAYAVKVGDEVKQGQVIGFTGNTGDSTTPHLHFEYRVNQKPLDPAFIFEASGMIEGQAVTNLYSQNTSNVIVYNNEKLNFSILQK